MRKAMFTIEVLISIFILFLVITLSATSTKFSNQILKQQERYKSLYSMVFSIKDKISDDICQTQSDIYGELSHMKYHATCAEVKSQRGLVKDYDFDNGEELIAYTGAYRFTLYRVTLEIEDYQFVVHYYINTYKKFNA
jgi:hypothetical protein